jgi:hypothetical protein
MDADVERFGQELAQVCARFQRVEALAFTKLQEHDTESAMRLSITQLNGSETDRVIYVTKGEEAQVGEIEKRVADMLAESSNVGLAGAVRALWKALRAHSEEMVQ